jgi:hypothetical protein
MTKQKNNFIPINDEQIAMIERTEERKNRFSGESYMLTPAEAIKHDRIFINELGATT